MTYRGHAHMPIKAGHACISYPALDRILMSLQVLPTEKALQLLREGQSASGDFSAADAASRKLLHSLMEKRAEAKHGTSGQAFYGRA